MWKPSSVTAYARSVTLTRASGRVPGGIDFAPPTLPCLDFLTFKDLIPPVSLPSHPPKGIGDGFPEAAATKK